MRVTQVTQRACSDAPVARRNRHTKRKGRRTYKRANDAKARAAENNDSDAND